MMKVKVTIFMIALFGGATSHQCGLYLAKSTIDGAGLGVFTGVSREKDEVFSYDPAVPILDEDFHAGGSQQKEDYHWLMSEYVWKATSVGLEMENEADTTSAFVPGLGSMPNCHLRLVNIIEDKLETHDNGNIGRGRTDPGVGSMTPYYDRPTYANRNIQEGQELFVDYGEQWFLTRTADMGLVPVISSYPVANRFMSNFGKFSVRIIATQQQDSDDIILGSHLSEALSDLWDMILQMPYTSRPLAAIPKSFSLAKKALNKVRPDYNDIAKVGKVMEQFEFEQSIRSLDWLKENGRCLDNIVPGNSTIEHAGRGAFAKTDILIGEYIHIAPLIHIPDRDVLTMYADVYDHELEQIVRDTSNPIGHQPLLNYCFGHHSSSMLLCSYGSLYINHSKKPNAKIVWASDPYNTASWLEQPVAYFDNVWRTGMAFEYIALTDIKEGDEITVDYGNEWQEAWDKHVDRWEPPENANTYISSQQLNADPAIPIPTYDEDDTLIDGSIECWCHFQQSRFKNDSRYTWKKELDMGQHEELVVEISDRIYSEDSEDFLYTVVLMDRQGVKEISVRNVPREALSFTQSKYRSDFYINGAFRHEIMIPDEIFPPAWKNLE